MIKVEKVDRESKLTLFSINGYKSLMTDGKRVLASMGYLEPSELKKCFRIHKAIFSN